MLLIGIISQKRGKMKLEKLNILDDYLRWLKSYKRDLKYKSIAINTEIVYDRVLNNFYLFISESKISSLKEIDREFFLDFMDYTEEDSQKQIFTKKTKQLYFSILKSFFLYISDNNDEFYTYQNEFKISIKGVNKSSKVKYLTDKEILMVLDYLNKKIENRGSYYDYIYSFGIKLMLFGGLRISEALNLRVDDFIVSDLLDENKDRDMYEIHLENTKAQEQQSAIVKIIDIEKELDYFRDSDYIFLSTKGTKINRSNFYVAVNNIMKKAGVDKKGLHLYRHTCAMSLYRKSKDILVTKEKLRHSDIKTTMIYAKAEKNDIAKAMR